MISVTELVTQLRAENMNASEDAIQRLRDEGLAPLTKRMGRRGCTYTPAQAEHIRRVFLIQRDLGPKWSFEELAFWMAAYGMRPVPPTLVAEHMKKGIADFISAGIRIADRAATGRRVGQGTPAHRMAVFAIRKFIRGLGRSIDLRAVAPTVGLFEFILNLWYFQRPLSELSGDLRKLAYQWYDPSDADREFMRWQEWLMRNAGMFSKKPDANLFNRRIRLALDKNPQAILVAAGDALRAVLLLRRAVDPLSMPEGAPGETNTRLYVRMFGGLTPMLAGVSLDLQLKNPRNPYLERLRRGDDMGLPGLVASIMSGELLNDLEKSA